MSRFVKTARILLSILLVLAVAYFAAFKAGWLPPHAALFAATALVLCVWLLAELFWATAQLIRRTVGLISGVGSTLVLIGGVLILGGGLANWVYRLEGFILMAEGDAAPFFHGSHLQEFDAGLLSNPKEMELVLHLDKIRLEATGGGAFLPVSHLRLARDGSETHGFELSPERSVADGTLRFHHGAFGYAPRIVITEGSRTLFDKIVPFTTRRDERQRVSFLGEFTIKEHDLHVRGEVSLDTLDPDMRGHPRLILSVERSGELLGSGPLMPGRFASLDSGHRIGFAGLKKWAEIDIARKSYPEPMIAGAVLLGLGLVMLAVGLARNRRGGSAP